MATTILGPLWASAAPRRRFHNRVSLGKTGAAKPRLERTRKRSGVVIRPAPRPTLEFVFRTAL